MKKIFISFISLAIVLFTSTFIVNAKEDNTSCYFQFNEEGEYEYVCVDENIMPCVLCSQECWPK